MLDQRSCAVFPVFYAAVSDMLVLRRRLLTRVVEVASVCPLAREPRPFQAQRLPAAQQQHSSKQADLWLGDVYEIRKQQL